MVELGGKLFCLLVGKLQLTVEDQGQTSRASVLEFHFLESGGLLSGGRECGLEIGDLPQDREQRCRNLVAQLGAKRAGEERLAKQSAAVNAANFGAQTEASILFD